MFNKKLGLVLLPSVLIFSSALFTFSQAGPGKMSQATSVQRRTIEGMDQIAKAQQVLRNQGIYYGDIDGTMNSKFHRALRDYQALNELYPTGRLDSQTLAKLGISSGRDTTPTVRKPIPNKFTLIYLWSPDEVRQLQAALKQRGFDPGGIDGIVGPKTKTAITEFQQQQGLRVSGNLDRPTEVALGLRGTTETGEVRSPETAPLPAQVELPPPVQPNPIEVLPYPYPPNPIVIVPDVRASGWGDPNMGVGMASVPEDIREAQMQLKNRGFDPGDINGMLNAQTQDALRRFQQANELPVTGTFDSRTQGALGITVRGTSNPDPFH